MTTTARPGLSAGVVPGPGPERGFDATKFLTAYLVVLFGIPSPMIVAPLGTLGAPAVIIAMLAFAWWAWHQLNRSVDPLAVIQPIRRVVVGFLLVMLLVYAHAMSQPLPADELTPADSALIRMFGLMGILLLAGDGLSTTAQWHTLMRRIAIAGGLVSVLSIVQFVTHQSIVDHLSLPGLTNGASEFGVLDRAGLTRPSGTATHPLEFGAVLGIILPMAISTARRSLTHRIRWWAIVAGITLAIMLCLSRTALICLVIGAVTVVTTWPRRQRLTFLLSAAALGVGAGVAVPGLLGTIRGLFEGASGDPSVTSRTASYGVAFDFITQNPWLGRGYGTFGPKYWILDNLYLTFTIETGIVGVLALLALLLTAAWTALRASRVFRESEDRDAARALMGSVLAGIVSLAFFDEFSFPQSAGCLFLALGLTAAASRLSRQESLPGQTGASPPVTSAVAPSA